MKTKVTRRAALAGLAALAPTSTASALPEASSNDPSIATLAKLREACAVRDVYLDKNDDVRLKDDFFVIHDTIWDAFEEALETEPTTVEGHAMKLDFPMEIVITSNTTYMLFDSSTPRRIYTDGRDWPKDMEPSFLGYSIGKWIDENGDGRYDVLEVETHLVRGHPLL